MPPFTSTCNVSPLRAQANSEEGGIKVTFLTELGDVPLMTMSYNMTVEETVKVSVERALSVAAAGCLQRPQ